MPLSQGALRRLADNRKAFRQQVVQGLAFCQTLPKRRGHPPQFFIGQGLEPWLQGIDLFHPLEHGAELAFIDGTEKTLRNGGKAEHGYPLTGRPAAKPACWQTRAGGQVGRLGRAPARDKNRLCPCQFGRLSGYLCSGQRRALGLSGYKRSKAKNSLKMTPSKLPPLKGVELATAATGIRYRDRN